MENTNLKDRIKALANEKGISLPTLEAELGFGNSTIVKWDKSTPNAEKLNTVAKYFNVSMDYLLNGTDIFIETKNADIAKDESERRLLMLCRKAGEVSQEEKDAIIDSFENSIDLFLKAKGFKKGE